MAKSIITAWGQDDAEEVKFDRNEAIADIIDAVCFDQPVPETIELGCFSKMPGPSWHHIAENFLEQICISYEEFLHPDLDDISDLPSEIREAATDFAKVVEKHLPIYWYLLEYKETINVQEWLDDNT